MKLLFFITIALFSNTAFAQILEPQIKFRLYFEDAVGNKDTVTVGFDPDADANIDTAFGEINLRGTPFDETFEVRGADKSGYEFQSKITVQNYDDVFCQSWPWIQYQSVVLYAKHWPVTIKWDRPYFQEACYSWSHLTRIWEFLFHPNFVNGDIAKLATNDSVVVTKNYLHQTNGLKNHRLEPIEGGGQDTVYVIWVGLASVYSSSDVSGTEVSAPKPSVSPNPARDFINISIPPDGEGADIIGISIEDLLGRAYLLDNWGLSGDGIRIPVGQLGAGFYFGKIRYKNNRVKVFDFVKTE